MTNKTFSKKSCKTCEHYISELNYCKHYHKQTTESGTCFEHKPKNDSKKH